MKCPGAAEIECLKEFGDSNHDATLENLQTRLQKYYEDLSLQTEEV